MKKYAVIIPVTILSVALLVISSCNKDDDNNNNPKSIGDNYEGGKVAYILQPGDPGYDPDMQHGLIAAPSDQSTAITWYNGSFTTTGAIAQELGDGNANTNAIIANQGAGNYAARLCYDLVLDGYSDWYMPSWRELEKLYDNRVAIGGFATDANSLYWSSSEVVALTPPNAGVFFVYFMTGQSGQDNKNNAHYVRAVRSF